MSASKFPSKDEMVQAFQVAPYEESPEIESYSFTDSHGTLLHVSFFKQLNDIEITFWHDNVLVASLVFQDITYLRIETFKNAFYPEDEEFRDKLFMLIKPSEHPDKGFLYLFAQPRLFMRYF